MALHNHMGEGPLYATDSDTVEGTVARREMPNSTKYTSLPSACPIHIEKGRERAQFLFIFFVIL